MQALNNNPSPAASWFTQHKNVPFSTNRRLGVRFIRDDILISLHKINFLKLGLKLKPEETFVKLIDISSKGLSIATDLKLSTKTKVHLTINFLGLKTFEVAGTVVRISKGKRPVYGIKFDQVNNSMAEYLVFSQKKLTFK